MSFSFPTSPSINQLYTFGNKTWKYNGTGWILVTNLDVAQTAWNKANLANVQANTATVLAQGAFDNSNTKFSSTGGTIDGSVDITQNLSVTGNLTVLGSSTSINTSSFTVQDTLLLLGLGNYTSDLLDIGFVSHYNDGTNAHTGIIRDASEKRWMFFEDYTPEVSPNNNIIITDPSFRYSNVRVRDVTGNLIANTVHVNGYNLFDYTTNSFTHANGAYDQANSAANYANSAFNYANSAYTQANNALANTTGTFGGDLTISGNLIVTGANVALGNVGNVHIYGGNTGQLLTTDNFGNLSFIDLPTPNTISYTANTLTLTSGVYVSGNVTDTQVLNDGLYYQLTDGTGSAPAWIITFGFTGITKFNRIVSNIDYTLASGHIIYFQLYNYTTSFTLASGTVTTTSGANTVTVSSTTGMSVGQTIKFGTSVGNLVAGNTYYILSVPTPGQLTVGTGTSAASIVIQSNNSVTSTVIIESWDNFGSYSGASGFEQSAHEVLDYTDYVSSGVVAARLYHSNQGSASHISKIDYFALQQSSQGGQGPRGATGATGSTGPTGPGVATGGTVGQVLIKNSSTNYDTTWSNNLINAYDGANSAGSYANSSFDTANSASLYANGAFLQANAVYQYANTLSPQDNVARNTANSAALYANGAFLQANAAFDVANNALPKTGGTLSGSLTVNGDLFINGTTTTVNTTTVSTTDSLIKLANNNTTSDTLDIGFYGVAFTNGQITYQGLARQAGSNNFLLFKGLTQDPSGNSLAAGSATASNVGTLIANVAGYSITSNGVDLFLYTTNAYTQANTGVNNASGASLYANAAFLKANTPDAIANSAALYANGAFLQANAAFLQANTPSSTANSAASYANAAFIQANAVYQYANTLSPQDNVARSTANAAFDRANNSLNVATGGTVTGNLTVTQTIYADRIVTTSVPLVLNDISSQFDGSKQVFSLKVDQANVSNTYITESKNLEVVINGRKLAPYIKQLTYPWLTPYDSFKGFRVVATSNSADLILYNTADSGSEAVLTIINTTSTVQTRKYPFSAATITLGD